jgi:hypothetical protein
LSPAITITSSSTIAARSSVKATSPIAPRRSSLDVVPSSCTVTPGLNIAQCWKSWAKR